MIVDRKNLYNFFSILENFYNLNVVIEYLVWLDIYIDNVVQDLQVLV